MTHDTNGHEHDHEDTDGAPLVTALERKVLRLLADANAHFAAQGIPAAEVTDMARWGYIAIRLTPEELLEWRGYDSESRQRWEMGLAAYLLRLDDLASDASDASDEVRARIRAMPPLEEIESPAVVARVRTWQATFRALRERRAADRYWDDDSGGQGA